MNRQCKTCLSEFNGPDWMNQCRECYENFRGRPRIEVVTGRMGVFIQSHSTVTKEEVDAFILKKYGSVNDSMNWGAVEVAGKRKLWLNCQNDD